MLESIGLLQLSAQRMRYLGQRQALIGANIANADTPGYRAKDLQPFATSEALAQSDDGASPLRMVATNPGHIGFGVSGEAGAKLDARSKSYDEKLDANNVSVEEQEMKANDVANSYDLASVAYKKSVELIKSGLGVA